MKTITADILSTLATLTATIRATEQEAAALVPVRQGGKATRAQMVAVENAIVTARRVRFDFCEKHGITTEGEVLAA